MASNTKGSTTMKDTSAATVEAPSRLLMFYQPTLSNSISAYFPCHVIRKHVGEKVTVGRSSCADVRLNDERMSRTYAEIWNDGRDPFVFKIRNISERKMLLVDSKVLNKDEQASIKDNCTLKLDFVELLLKVCPGDAIAETYEVSVIKNAVVGRGPLCGFGSSYGDTVPSSSLLRCLMSPTDSEGHRATGKDPANSLQPLSHEPLSKGSKNDLDSGYVFDTSGKYRPNIPANHHPASIPRCHDCLRAVPGKRGLSPCENSDVINDGTTDENIALDNVL
ncbi:uncharacterized protein LOC124285210 [Haliotis rubra]|uniref:uncharacterized protein LOC124285210 n=1 Tax=Haliotis rubra TaxID=36100 RepID=UPI001EE54F8D|nr:uncharacterized protein LOC124285210 [Haliotis rubra]